MKPGGGTQVDRFVHERLPPQEAWPEIVRLEGLAEAAPVNCVTMLLDRHLEGAGAARTAIRSGARSWTYGELNDRVCRIAQVLAEEFGIVSGNRVLIRGANSPEVAAIWLATQKLGAVAVTTMSLLRKGELKTILETAQPSIALCEESLAGELDSAVEASEQPVRSVRFGVASGELYRLMQSAGPTFATRQTHGEDVSLIAFTSGTTGRPKAAVHFQHDILTICKTVGRHIVDPRPDDVFIGTSPLAFTFGLGGLLVFPLYAGATTVLNARYSPEELVECIAHFSATVCFTVPSFYQQMLKVEGVEAAGALRLAVSSGEALPPAVREAWRRATGNELTELLGSTEMLHAFAGSTGRATRAGRIGPAIHGYEVAVLDADGRSLPAGEIGRLAVKGPTGCRYLDDERQADYVQGGWNITGDACALDDGYVVYHTRFDDMIVSSGYNISGIEVENALLQHPDVAECAVVAEPDPERGQIVVAHVVPRNGEGTDDLVASLQEHVKSVIAPYKYPRTIYFAAQLPRNESGKIQRFKLKR